MKNWKGFILVLACVLVLMGCSGGQGEAARSFYGEHDYFAITNGSITWNAAEEVFDGGELEVIQPDVFENVASFSTVFYTVKDAEKHIILSNSVTDETGGTADINGGLGRIAGADIIGGEAEDIDNLWFELKTTDLDGYEHTYQLRLILND